MSKAASFEEAKLAVRAAIEAQLFQEFGRFADDEVRRVAEYATLGSGHRWRAILAMAAGEIFDRDAFAIVLPAACSIELVQAATLILDDLPSMDDATVRRGKPCAHLVFSPWAVDLAPSFLMTLAYELALDNPRAPAERRTWAAVELSRAGLTMISGQARDVLRPEHQNSSFDLIELAKLKAGAFYGASMMVGGILCGATSDEAKRLYDAGMYLGLSYQALDDVADVIATLHEVGKHPGSDAGKYTLADWLGVEGAQRQSREFVEQALSKLEPFSSEADWLRSIVTEASWKSH